MPFLILFLSVSYEHKCILKCKRIKHKKSYAITTVWFVNAESVLRQLLVIWERSAHSFDV